MMKKLFFLSVILFLCGVARGAQYLPSGLALAPLGVTAHSCLTKNKVTPADIKHYWPGPGGKDTKTGTVYPASPSWAAWQNHCVAFYHGNQNYYCFSNTFLDGSQDPKVGGNNKFSYKIDGFDWESTEHYFHARKYTNLGKVHGLLKGRAPGSLPNNIKGLGTDKTLFNALKNEQLSFGANWKQWDETSPDVMLKAIRAKFSQHDALKKVLLDTYPKMLVENTADADYEENLWGAGRYYTGCNLLGQVLMHVREELRDGKLYVLKKEDALYYYQLLSGQTAWQKDESNDLKNVPDGYLDELKKAAVTTPSLPPSGPEPLARMLFFNYDPVSKTWRVHLYKTAQGTLRGYGAKGELEENKVSKELVQAFKSGIAGEVEKNVTAMQKVAHDNKEFNFVCRYLKATPTLPFTPLADIALNKNIEKETQDMLLNREVMNTAINKMKQNNVIPQDTPLPYPDDSDLIKLVQVLKAMAA